MLRCPGWGAAFRIFRCLSMMGLNSRNLRWFKFERVGRQLWHSWRFSFCWIDLLPPDIPWGSCSWGECRVCLICNYGKRWFIWELTHLLLMWGIYTMFSAVNCCLGSLVGWCCWFNSVLWVSEKISIWEVVSPTSRSCTSSTFSEWFETFVKSLFDLSLGILTILGLP